MINSSNDRPTPSTQRSIGELVASIKAEVTGVVQQQLDIAKKEVTNIAVKAGAVAALAAVLLFFLVSAWVMFLFFAAWGLVALGLPAWASFLIICGVLVLLGAILGGIAFVIVKKITAPETTIETTQSAVQAVQGKRRENSVDYDDAFEELYGKRVENSDDSRVEAGSHAVSTKEKETSAA